VHGGLCFPPRRSPPSRFFFSTSFPFTRYDVASPFFRKAIHFQCPEMNPVYNRRDRFRDASSIDLFFPPPKKFLLRAVPLVSSSIHKIRWSLVPPTHAGLRRCIAGNGFLSVPGVHVPPNSARALLRTCPCGFPPSQNECFSIYNNEGELYHPSTRERASSHFSTFFCSGSLSTSCEIGTSLCSFFQHGSRRCFKTLSRFLLCSSSSRCVLETPLPPTKCAQLFFSPSSLFVQAFPHRFPFFRSLPPRARMRRLLPVP